MALTNAEHQAATRLRRKQRIADLEARVVELERQLTERSAGHKACDALERELRAEIAGLQRQLAPRPCGDPLRLCVYSKPHDGPHKVADIDKVPPQYRLGN